MATGVTQPVGSLHLAVSHTHIAVARASWTAAACPRARARDERVARGRRRESAGEGVAKWCPETVRSCSSHCSHGSRIESAGEGVAERSVRVPHGRLGHTATARRVWGGCINQCPTVAVSCSSHLLTAPKPIGLNGRHVVALAQSSDACDSIGGANASALASSSDTEHPPIVAACSRVSVRARYSVNAVATDLDVIGYTHRLYGHSYNSIGNCCVLHSLSSAYTTDRRSIFL